ncbi:MAG: NAD(+) synthase, partial [Paramuribaculum sp.]|nr:NAD(+) synthase [Paramuribaculum sp.]
CAYAYASAVYGESSTVLVYSGKALIAERGTMLAENDRWNPESRYVIADIDIEAIERDRIHTTSFADSAVAAGVTPAATTLSDRHSDPVWLPEYRSIDPHPFVPSRADDRNSRCTEIVNIQTAGLARRLDAIHCRSLTVGISGGLDSTLALLVAARAFDRLNLPRTGIIGVTMPGFGTTGRTYDNALSLMRGLGVTIREVPIAEAVNLHFRDIGHDPAIHDITYENSQARERTQILMDIANQTGGIVLGTGDLSELALGWATYNGDHMSMYGINCGVPKTLVRYLVEWFADRHRDAGNTVVADTLADIVDTPVSPELLPHDADGNIAQKTEDTVGPYTLHDFFLYYTLRFGFSPTRIYQLAQVAFRGTPYDDRALILKWLKVFFRRFFTQQFKRSCLPDGPKVGSVCLSPRGDWRMPSDASAALWLAEIDRLTTAAEA